MKTSLNIIISNYDDIHNPYYSGGGAHAMHQIALRLAKHHRVTIISGKYKGSQDGLIEGVRYIHSGVSFGGPLTGQIFFALSLPFVLQKHVFDVWFENFVPPHSTNMLQLFTKKPVIGITSLLDASKFSEKYHVPFHLIEGVGLKVYRYFIALTPIIEKKIRMQNKNARVNVIPDGISSTLFKLKGKEKPYVYFLGRLDIFQKGLDTLVDAWNICVKQYPGITLILAGEGTPRDHRELVEKINTMGLSNSVKLTGRLEGKQKDDLIRNSLAGVFPSRFESFGIAPLEALAAGKPMVCFDIEGFSWIDPDVCIKVNTLDASSLAKALHKVLSQKRTRMALGKKARVFARPFAWDRIAGEYERFAIDVSQKDL